MNDNLKNKSSSVANGDQGPPALAAATDMIASSNRELSDNLDRLVSLFESSETSLNQVATEMRRHDGLTDKLLKRVNSAEFGFNHNVKEIEHAIAILGQTRTIQVMKEQILRSAKRSKRSEPAESGERQIGTFDR